MSDRPAVILASQSSTRYGLLHNAGLAVTMVAAGVDEAGYKESYRAEGQSASATAIALAEIKALKVSRRFPEALVIGADQMLECRGDWFDKPDSLAMARDQLLALRGQRHELHSALVIARGGERIWHTLDSASLTMRAFSEAFLGDYLAAVDDTVLSSVGGYHIEGLGIQLFERVEGQHSTILGLPLLPLLAFLRPWGVVMT